MNQRVRIVVFMITLAAIFGGAVAGIYLASRPVLERNRALRAQRAYIEVFGLAAGAVSDNTAARLTQTRIVTGETIIDPTTGRSFTLIRGYADDEKRELIGIAFRFRGLALWGPVDGLLALTPDLTTTRGLVILEHQETPGLGGRIEEPVFTLPFKHGISVTPPENGNETFIEISSNAPAPDSPMAKRHVMAVTGATQTSLAMERILNDTIASFNRAIMAAENPQTRQEKL